MKPVNMVQIKVNGKKPEQSRFLNNYHRLSQFGIRSDPSPT